MNATSISRRFSAFFAAAAVTLVMLAGIDGLSAHQAPQQMAAAATHVTA